jgi:penicillin-insensitive murein endopeptidase
MGNRATALLLAGLLDVSSARADAIESVCYGTASRGRLENGVQIPKSGPNFAPYSSLGVSLGRTYVHSEVATTIAAAYASLASTDPDKTFVYGESGWRGGGRIRPHRTHQNGIAVDFMVPVIDARGRSLPLPTGIQNRFGYGIEFDADGRYDGLTIDFDAIADHLHAMHEAAQHNGIGIARVIFEKAYIPRLYATTRGAFLRESVPFMQGEPWIRHDEHYHVDFAVPCRPMSD